jgi:hypothetical protein
MDGMAGRVLAAIIAAMPPSRRTWGEAMLAELSYPHSRGQAARLVLGAVRVALLPPAGLAPFGRAVGRAALLAVAAWVPLAAGLFLSNVVFPAGGDSTVGDLAMDLYIVITLMAAGAVARRAAGGVGHSLVAGLTAGLILAALGMGTFTAIDNVFLSVVSHQPGKMAGFQASGLSSVRTYINDSLEATAPGVALVLSVLGACLGYLGAQADRAMGAARARGGLG